MVSRPFSVHEQHHVSLPQRYICTLAAAEQLYDALYQWHTLTFIEITSTSLPFFRDLNPTIEPGRYDSSSLEYRNLTSEVGRYADEYVAIVKKYTPPDGALSEQFDRNDGHPLSARNLTWSYASFLAATSRRQSTVPAPWGESSANTIPPSGCVPSSATGTYAPPIPEKPCPTPTGIAVTFNVLKTTIFGQNLFLYGSIPTLGDYDVTKGLPLDASKYTQDKPLWSVRAVIPPEIERFEYNYYFVDVDGKSVVKEGGGRRTVEVPENATKPEACLGKVVVDDIWQ